MRDSKTPPTALRLSQRREKAYRATHERGQGSLGTDPAAGRQSFNQWATGGAPGGPEKRPQKLFDSGNVPFIIERSCSPESSRYGVLPSLYAGDVGFGALSDRGACVASCFDGGSSQGSFVAPVPTFLASTFTLVGQRSNGMQGPCMNTVKTEPDGVRQFCRPDGCWECLGE